MRFLLVDHWGDQTILTVDDPGNPVLRDEKGSLAVDLTKGPYVPDFWEKDFLDRVILAFITRDVGIPFLWVGLPDDVFSYHLEVFREAMLTLTGKLLIGVSE